MPKTLILAKDIREANEYARFVGLQRFTYRPVQKAGSIAGVRNAVVHKLTSFDRRPDRHAILAELRHARTLTVIDVDFAMLREAYRENALFDHERSLLVGHGLDPLGVLAGPPGDDCFSIPDDGHASQDASTEVNHGLEVLHGIAAVVGGGLRLSEDEVAALAGEDVPSGSTREAEPSEESAPVTKPGRAPRRRRCPECEDLFAPEDFDAHLDTHAKPITLDQGWVAPAAIGNYVNPANFFGGE